MDKSIPNFAHIRRVSDRQVLAFVEPEVTDDGESVFTLVIAFDSIARHRVAARAPFKYDADADAALLSVSIGKMDERIAEMIADADLLDAAKN